MTVTTQIARDGDGHVIGYAQITDLSDYASSYYGHTVTAPAFEIAQLYVARIPFSRGKGIGRWLMAQVIHAADGCGAVLWLCAQPNDEDGALDAVALRAWYRRLRFEPMPDAPKVMRRLPGS